MNRSRPADICVRAATMRDVAHRSKAFWGYDQAFMETVGPTLAPTENDVSDGVFLLECDGVPAGFYAFKVKAESYFLDSLFLAPEWIGLGFGERLWHHAVDFARRSARPHFLIESDPNAEGFYLRMGARRVGEIVSVVSGRTLPLLRFECVA